MMACISANTETGLEEVKRLVVGVAVETESLS
jgi:hypothetical protein